MLPLFILKDSFWGDVFRNAIFFLLSICFFVFLIIFQNDLYLFYSCICLFVCACVSATNCGCVWIMEEIIRSPEAGFRCGYELPRLGTRNWTWVFWQNSSYPEVQSWCFQSYYTHTIHTVIFPVTLILFVCLLLHFIHFFIFGDWGAHVTEYLCKSENNCQKVVLYICW